MPHGGMGTHQSSSMQSDEWLTPPEVLRALGRFDLDPCACSEPRPWITADRHFTREDNGLRQSWDGRVWLNPPYGGPNIVGPWMRRMVQHGRGTALIFARTETDLFHETVWRAATSVLFLKGRLYFHRRDGGRAAANAGAPSCLVAYGRQDSTALRKSGLAGHLLTLRHTPGVDGWICCCKGPTADLRRPAETMTCCGNYEWSGDGAPTLPHPRHQALPLPPPADPAEARMGEAQST